jgi:hypothetical protein
LATPSVCSASPRLTRSPAELTGTFVCLATPPLPCFARAS